MSRLLRKLAFCSKTDTVPSTQPVDPSSNAQPTECAVCQDPPTKPCTVPCGNRHVFCQACLQGIVTHSHHRSHFPCPLCRKQVRIPLGGVRAFRQGKGGRGGRRLLARVLPGRCRWRRNSTDSFSSSGWPVDDRSLSSFDARGDIGDDLRGWYPPSDSDHDDMDDVVDYNNADNDDDDDDASSIGGPSGEDWIRQLNLDPSSSSGNNVLDPEQILILQSLRELDQAMILQTVRDRPGEDLAVAERGNEGASGGGGGGRRPSLRMAGFGSVGEQERGGIVPPDISLFLSDSNEDLDMTVVLQLIADMEKNDREEHAAASAPSPAKTQGKDDVEQDQAGKEIEKPAESPLCHRSCPETVQEAEQTGISSPESTQHQEAARDWKFRTIADTAIPRPKLTFVHGTTTGERRSFRLPDGDEGEGGEEDRQQPRGPEHLPQQASFATSHWEGEAESPLHPGMGESEEEELQTDHVRLQETTTNSSSQETESSEKDDHEYPQINSCLPSGVVLTNEVKVQTDLPPPELPQTENPDDELNSSPMDSPKNSPLDEGHDHDHDSQHRHRHPQHTTTTTTSITITSTITSSSDRQTGGFPPSEDFSPTEGWRRQELLNLQEAKLKPAGAGTRILAAEEDDDERRLGLGEDTSAAERDVISEGPSEWVRRIRSLQHRRRGPGKRSSVVGRSHSHGGEDHSGGGIKVAALRSGAGGGEERQESGEIRLKREERV